MVSFRFVVSGVACAFCVAAAVDAAEDTEKSLDTLGIKCSRDSEGTIVAVELPERSNDFDFAVLLKVPSLVAISAPDCRASSKAIESLSALPHLATLHFERASDANGIAYSIRNIKTLKSLTLANSQLTNHGLDDILAAHHDLRELIIYTTKIDKNAWPILVQFVELETLNISNCRLDPFPKRASERGKPGPFAKFGNFPNLRRLSATQVHLGSADLYPLGNCCHLEYLGIDRQVNDHDAHALIYLQETFPKLRLGPQIVRSLDTVENRTVTSTVDRNGNVSTLRCTYPTFLKIPPRVLAELRDLHLIGVTNLQPIDFLPKLTRLTLEYPPEVEGIPSLARFPRLDSLIVQRGKIDERYARALLSLGTLKSISIEFCEVTADAIALLRDKQTRVIISVTP